MPLQFRADTGALIMLDSGALANECCCPPAIPDLTPIMRSLSEALHYIADENSLNQEFGGVQGDAWPTQRAAPFLPPPADGENIPADFYEGDYIADIQNAYDDLQTIIDNYNYVKNFFLKTNPFEGASSLADFTGADDYAPGTINASNFNSIRSAIVTLTNAIVNVMIQASQVSQCTKQVLSQNFADTGDWLNRQNCADSILPSLDCQHNIQYDTAISAPGCDTLASDFPIAIYPKLYGFEQTALNLDPCNNSQASKGYTSGYIQSDLSNFPSANQAGVYLKLIDFPGYDFSPDGPVPLPNVYQKWITPTVGINYSSPTVTGSDTGPVFSFTGPTPACSPGSPDVFVHSGWFLDDMAVILTRAQVHIAS